jgi:hypothetical protein
MKKYKQNKGKFVSYCLHILGILLCICPPAVCTLSYFPLWKESSGKTLAGGAFILLLLSAYPILKLIKKQLSSAASYTVWLVIFIIFFMFSRIAYEMTVISFYGFTGNLLGAICFWIAKRGTVQK